MTPNELRELGEHLAISLTQNKNVESITYSIARVMSYLISEQDKRQELQDHILNHSKQMEEFKKGLWRLDAMDERSKSNSKMIKGVLGSVVTVLLLELIKLAFSHK